MELEWFAHFQEADFQVLNHITEFIFLLEGLHCKFIDFQI